jgi:3-isopropylmalate dehydrogenase
LKKIAVIPGDGIGPEVINEAVKVLKEIVDFKLQYFNLGGDFYLKYKEALPEEIKKELKNYDAILLGAIGDPRVPAGILERDLLLNLRFSFDQYVNLRPVKLLDARLTPLKNVSENDVDFIVVRENTEGAYCGIGGFFKYGTEEEIAHQIDINTYRGVERIIDYSFKLAKKRKRKKLVMSDKSNVLTYGHNLWQRIFEKKKKEYPEIEATHIYIDALCMQMIKNPSQFEVIVTCNMFGDIITDLGAQIQGGMGVAGSGNINPKGISMFEPVHGSAPKYKGKNLANPLATILSAGMMLEYLGYKREAKRIEKAVQKAIKEDKVTPDLGGGLGTREVGDWVVRYLKEG